MGARRVVGTAVGVALCALLVACSGGAAAVTGDFYIVYRPDGLDAARGIWQLSNP